MALGIEKPRSQGRGKSRPAVIGCAASQTHDNSRVSPFQGFLHYLAGPGGGGDSRVAAALRNQSQAGRKGHLYDHGAAVAHNTPLRLQRLPQRPGYRAGEEYSPPVPSTRALSVPSPPSATGASTVSASGTAAATPRAMAWAASSPEIPALNPCGAITIFIMAEAITYLAHVSGSGCVSAGISNACTGELPAGSRRT